MNLLRAEHTARKHFHRFDSLERKGGEGRNDSRISPPPRSSTLLEKKKKNGLINSSRFSKRVTKENCSWLDRARWGKRHEFLSISTFQSCALYERTEGGGEGLLA